MTAYLARRLLQAVAVVLLVTVMLMRWTGAQQNHRAVAAG